MIPLGGGGPQSFVVGVLPPPPPPPPPPPHLGGIQRGMPMPMGMPGMMHHGGMMMNPPAQQAMMMPGGRLAPPPPPPPPPASFMGRGPLLPPPPAMMGGDFQRGPQFHPRLLARFSTKWRSGPPPSSHPQGPPLCEQSNACRLEEPEEKIIKVQYIDLVCSHYSDGE